LNGWFLLALVEIGAGLLGLGVTGLAALRGGAVTLGVLLLATAVFGLCLVAGVLLLFDYAAGRPLSMLVQALQVVQVSSAALVWRFVAGPQVTLGMRAGEFTYGAGMFVDLTVFAPVPAGEPRGVLINVIALGCLLGLMVGARAGRASARAAA
jgi:hypothetical protein